MDRDLVLAAGGIAPAGIRTSTPFHLAAFQAAGDDLAGVVTSDDRMTAVAPALGLTRAHRRSVIAVVTFPRRLEDASVA